MGVNNDTPNTIRKLDKNNKLICSNEKKKYFESEVINIPKKCKSYSSKKCFGKNKQINEIFSNKIQLKNKIMKKNSYFQKIKFEKIKNQNLVNNTLTEDETIIDLGSVEFANSNILNKNYSKKNEKYKMINGRISKKSKIKEKKTSNKNIMKCTDLNIYDKYCDNNKKLTKTEKNSICKNEISDNKDDTKKFYSNANLNRDNKCKIVIKKNNGKINSKNTNFNSTYNTNESSLRRASSNECYTEFKKINKKNKRNKRNNYKIINKCASCSNEKKIINELSKNKIKQEEEIKLLKLKVENLYNIIEDTKTQRDFEIKTRDNLISALKNEKIKNENRISQLKKKLKNEEYSTNNLGVQSYFKYFPSHNSDFINGGLYTDENRNSTAKLNTLYRQNLYQNNNYNNKNIDKIKKHNNYYSTEANNNNCKFNYNTNLLYKKKSGKDLKNLKSKYHINTYNYLSNINMLHANRRPISIKNIPVFQKNKKMASRNKNENQENFLNLKMKSYCANNNIYNKLNNKTRITKNENKHSCFRISSSPIKKKYIYTSWNTNRNSFNEIKEKSANSKNLYEDLTKRDENLDVIDIKKVKLSQNKNSKNIIILNKNIQKFALIKEPDDKEQTLNLNESSSFSIITQKAKETNFLDEDTTLIDWPLLNNDKNNILKLSNFNKCLENKNPLNINNKDIENNEVIINSLIPHGFIKYTNTTTSNINVLKNIWKISFIIFNEKIDLFINKNILLFKAIYKLVDRIKAKKKFECQNIFDEYIFTHDDKKLFINKTMEQNLLFNNAIIHVVKNEEKNN